jgi:hypothetical protein
LLVTLLHKGLNFRELIERGWSFSPVFHAYGHHTHSKYSYDSVLLLLKSDAASESN